ncbi:MAG: glycosyltransferase [Deltaproteobacteria bacterium]|nr:glycosyltransferase [bacterium]MCB9477416.1 glycosyltransferase [Deltaproteobacteria bacterium]MCB9487879.1 glycosyltransferase [Deltaproteobacteria bacterium]
MNFDQFDIPRDVLMFSTADWDEPLWTNKQQIASRLAGEFRVLYVEPLASLRSRKRSHSHRILEDPSGVTVLRPPGAVPFGQKIAGINEINHRMLAPIVQGELARREFVDPILWLYPPTSAPMLSLYPFSVSLYDCVDEYSAMPGAWMAATKGMERALLKNVDCVTTTARTLFEDKKAYNNNTHFVPNVADFEHFHKTMTAKADPAIEAMPRPVVGFVGALNYKLDDELIDKIANARPDWHFVFVGPDRGFGVERFRQRHNLHFLGRRHIEDLPTVMAAMDVCWIPYRLDRYTRGVLPMKFYEYLASGRPVVATRLPELEAFEEHIGLAQSVESFVTAIEEQRAKKNDPTAREARIALARENSWEKRIGQILGHLETTWRHKRQSR